MSGSSYEDACPRCGSKEMDCYTDWKPVQTGQGVCLVCGFTFYTKMEVLDGENLQQAREERLENVGLEPKATWPELTNEQLAKIKDFDKRYGL